MGAEAAAVGEVEVLAPAEDTWEAVATGPGISAWFHPFDVEPHEGGAVSMDTGSGLTRIGEVTAYDPPRRFAYVEEPFSPAPGAEPAQLATETVLDPGPASTCQVRIATTGFGAGAAWETFRENVEFGWRVALVALRLRLEQWPDEPHASVFADARTTRRHADLWSRLTVGLGIPAAIDVGERLRSGPHAPAFAGEVVAVFDEWLVLRTTEPAPGVLHIGVHSQGEGEATRLDATFYGEEAEWIAQREEPRWRAWVEEQVA
jgi:uncharacterized protein YndB with AHSA1/START domain